MPAGDSQFVVEAKYYEKQPNRKIKCVLCPRECVIDDRERGYCGVRENRGGTYYTLVHSRVCAAHVDPVEKKPFFHFHPGTLAFSIATAGCNVNCKMCQNWEISQVRPEQVQSRYLRRARSPPWPNRTTVARSLTPTASRSSLRVRPGCRRRGARGGCQERGRLWRLHPTEASRRTLRHVDAIKVDLKAFSQKFYADIVNGELKPVLEALVTIRKLGTWNEIVYLVVPTLNDGDQEFRGLAKWIKGNLGVDVPVHFTRFQPQYLLKNLPPTPLGTLERAKAICDAEGLQFVYLGNVPSHPAEKTYCPKCRRVVVDRTGFLIRGLNLVKGRCRYCQQPIPGVWG